MRILFCLRFNCEGLANPALNVGYHGYHPPRIGQEEDILSENRIKHGYTDQPVVTVCRIPFVEFNSIIIRANHGKGRTHSEAFSTQKAEELIHYKSSWKRFLLNEPNYTRSLS